MEEFNETLYDEWVNKGDAPALPETLKNYNKLLSLGLSGRYLDKMAVTEANLKKAGFHTWEQLILKYVSFFLSIDITYLSFIYNKCCWLTSH